MPYLSLRGGGVAHFISKHLRRLTLAGGWCAIFVLAMIMSAMPVQVNAQFNCFNLSGGCVIAPAYSGTFQCIDALAHPDIDYWINIEPKMLQFQASENTPQYLVIKGNLKIQPVFGQQVYTFAIGSEIIFVDASSSIQVEKGATLIVKGSFLHGCNNVWNSVKATSINGQAGTIRLEGTATNPNMIADSRYGLWALSPNARVSSFNEGV